MSTPHIHALGVVGPFGSGRGALLQALFGDCVPEPAAVAMRGAGENSSQPALIADVEPLQRFFAKRALRRLDRFSRLALLGACLCLEDAGIIDPETDGGKPRLPEGEQGMGVILATGYGAGATTFAFLDSCIDDGDALASPTHFSHSVHNAAAANVAIQLGLQGPGLTVSQFGLSFASALATAGQWLREGRAPAVLLGGVDEACDVQAYCHARFAPGNHAPAALPGEGAAFFLLRPEAAAEIEGYGSVRSVTLLRPQEHTAGPATVLGGWGLEACAMQPAPVHSQLWGNTPVGQALDLAAACLRAPSHEAGAPVVCDFHSQGRVARITLDSAGRAGEG